MSSVQPVNYGRIATNMATTIFSEIVNKLSPLIILYAAQRQLGVQMFGLAQYALVFLEVLLPFVAFGYGTLGALEVGRFEGNRQKTGDFISAALGLRIMHLVSVVIVAGILVSQPTFDESRHIIFCISFMLIASCFETEFLHYGQQTLTIRNFIVVGSKLISVVGVLLLVRSEQDTTKYAVLTALPSLLISTGSAYYNLRNLPLRIPAFSEMKELFLKALPYALVIFLITLSDRYDIFVAEHFLDKSGAGFYAGQSRIVQSFATATSAFGLVFFTELVVPRVKEEFTKYVNLTLTTVLMIITPIAIGGLFVGKDILRLIYSEEFVPYVRVLDILMIATIAGAFFQVFGVYILLIKERVTYFNCALAAANVAGIGTACALASSYGLPGIALGNLLTKSLAAIFFIWGARNFLSKLPIKPVLQVLFCGGFMAGTLILFQPQEFILKILVGAVSYCASSLLIHYQFIKILKAKLLSKFLSKRNR